ncbi:MAG: hypothetical protein M3Z54_10930 [Gemmatimonadota bacterium]|nr:hypothetical protein [Gemmatimonadota bacterium]
MGVTRAALSGASRWRDFEVSGDVGINHNPMISISSARHTPGSGPSEGGD